MNITILLAAGWQEWTGWLTLLNFLLIGFSLLSILAIKKESISASAWCMTVIFIPFLGVFLYWMFGYQSVQRPLERKRRHAESYRQRSNTLMEAAATPEIEGIWQDLTQLATKLGASPLNTGNKIDLYHDGDSTFESMLQAIRAAKHHIHMEFFIFRADESGQRFIDAMVERARAGVQVRFLYDAVGSWGLHRNLLKRLTDAGGKVSPFLTLLNPLRRRVQINLRNHRKILIVDGRVGFTGGFNIGDEYLGKHPFFGHWRDTFLRLEGPAARFMQRVFIEDWHFATDEDLSDSTYFPKIEAIGSVPVQIAASGPDQELKTIRETYFAAIMRASDRVWIASPYFVPDTGLLDALCLAARSGRDVRLLCPFRPDKWLPFLAARFYWNDALAAGVKIYQYTKGFIHSKILIADNCWASVGSANFDNRSLFLNFEMTCLMQSREVVSELEKAYLNDLSQSIRVNPEEFAKRGFVSRLSENACRLMSPVL
ncbi:MAG: cardiolipin synthase [Planctomycetes bacterium]|nr:cardiolipin synthase [Planctomycetota bacterium]